MKNIRTISKFLTLVVLMGVFSPLFAGDVLPLPFWIPEKLKSPISPRQDHRAAIFNDSILVLGGEQDGSYLSTAVSSKDGRDWKEVSSQTGWSGRADYGAAILKNKIFIFGGFGVTGYKNDIWSSVDGKKWLLEDAKAEWPARAQVATISFRDKIWIFGGVDKDGYKNDIWSSGDGKTWALELENALWTPRAGHSVVAFKDKLFLLGGVGEEGRVNDVWSSLDGTSWTKEVADAPWFGRYGFSTVVSKDKIYILTAGEKFNNQNNLWSSLDGKTWEQEIVFPSFPFMIGYEIVLLDGKIFLIGGQSLDGEYNGNVYSYRLFGEDKDDEELGGNPNAPTSLSANATAGQVSLSWNAPKEDSAHKPPTFYEVYRGALPKFVVDDIVSAPGTDSDPKFPRNFLLATSTVGSYVDTTVLNGSTYYYRVVAVNEMGDSLASNEVSATPQMVGAIDIPAPDDDILSINNSFNSVFAPLFNLAISDWNASPRSRTANLFNAKKQNVGSIRLNFPPNSLYSEGDCVLGRCVGLNSAHPSIGFTVFSVENEAGVGFKSAVSNIPSNLNLLSSYPFYLEVSAPCSSSMLTEDCLSGYVSVLKAPIGMRLIVRSPEVANWKNAALYQYGPSSVGEGIWTKISNISEPIGGKTIIFNATTIVQHPGYLFAILGRSLDF